LLANTSPVAWRMDRDMMVAFEKSVPLGFPIGSTP
jgi:hypothetical protein